MPKQCPLHFSHDVFSIQELAKLHYRTNLWTCGICGKSFYREPYLDMHISNKHSESLLMVRKDISVITKVMELSDQKTFLILLTLLTKFCFYSSQMRLYVILTTAIYFDVMDIWISFTTNTTMKNIMDGKE